MKVCVYGAGAIGGHLAARLVNGGADVSVVVRPTTAAVLRKHGYLIKTLDGDIRASVTAACDARELGAQDYVVVTAKAPALPEIAAGIAPLLGPKTAVVFAMNGLPWWFFHAFGGALQGRRIATVDPGEGMWHAVGPERAIGAVVNTACTVVEPGVINVAGKVNRFALGEPDGSVSGRVEMLAGVMRAGGFTVDVTSRIRDEVWEKLVGNMCGVPLSVLTVSKAKDVYGDPDCERAIRQIMDEAIAIGRAVGCDIRIDPDAQIERGRVLNHKASMVQDLELGRPMEIDSMFSAPQQVARDLNISTPMLDLFIALLKQRARAAGLYQG
jgi:2-dehydropantoate 2-reductase